MSLSMIGALIHTDPAEAKRLVLEALVQAKGDRRVAARTLNTTHRSFYRFVERLKLWNDIDELAKKNGFPKSPGPPRSGQRIIVAIEDSSGDLARAARQLGMKVSVLKTRITEMGLWEEINEKLNGAGLPPVSPA